MESGNRRKFSREFKVEAVRMATAGDRSLNQVARDLDLHATVLRRWKRQLSDHPRHAFPGKGKLKEPDEENRRLRREIERLRDEVRHFKKSHQHLFQRKRVRFTPRVGSIPTFGTRISDLRGHNQFNLGLKLPWR